jgi:hypothetical protein
MSEKQSYKISHETLSEAIFALRVRIERIELMSEESRDSEYWKKQKRDAMEALAELEAL